MKILKRVLIIFAIIIGVIIIAVAILAGYNHFALKSEADKLVPPGQLVDVDGRKIHVYSEGENTAAPTLVFMSGSGTVAPTYDFKPLYSKLSDKYRIAVVEKAGYGYSDIVETERDIESMVTEARTALKQANINAPYVLLPHSMSGLEAIYWAQHYPEEVTGIAGIDMSTPESYDSFDFDNMKRLLSLGSASIKLGLARVPGVYPLNKANLTADEAYQQKLLAYRNALNIDYVIEGNAVYDNAQAVKSGEITCPILMFSSNGKEIGDFWAATQVAFAQANSAKHIVYDCGHYLHYYKAEEMAAELTAFITAI